MDPLIATPAPGDFLEGLPGHISLPTLAMLYQNTTKLENTGMPIWTHRPIEGQPASGMLQISPS